MKWSNLKQNKCPKCDKAFNYSAFKNPGYVVCTPECGFAIRERRYSEIVTSQINADLERKWDQEQEEL